MTEHSADYLRASGSSHINERHNMSEPDLRALVNELRAMRPSTDVGRHREDELGKLAYRRAINDALDRIALRSGGDDRG